MRVALVLLSLLALTAQPSLADGADWFAVSGVSFVEAVGAGQSFVLITRSGDGRFAVVATGEEFAPGMLVKKIGSQQVLVARTGNGEQSAAPILRQQVSAESLVAAICKLYNQNVVIGGDMTKLVAFSEGLLDYKKQLPILVKSLGFAYLADERAIVIRAEGVSRPMPAKVARKEGTFTALQIRTPVSAILGMAVTQTQRTFKAKAGELPVTIESSDLSPDELAGYLAAAVDTDIKEEIPKPEPAAAAAPASPGPAATSSAGTKPPGGSDASAIEQEYKQAVAIAKSGDKKKAANVLLRSLRTHRDVPSKVSNLLGKLLWSLGKKDMARKAWSYTLKREPGNPYARSALARTAGARS